MPRFLYRAVSHAGDVLQGEQEAPDRDAVIAHLRGLGHLPVHATEVIGKGSWFSTLAHWRPTQRLVAADRVLFTRELATLLQAGLTLDQSLQMLEQTCGSALFRQRIGTIRRAVQEGTAFPDALASHPDVFDALYVNLIRAGEAGGVLPAITERLATYLEQLAELRSSVVTALIYPAILVVVAGLSLVALMTMVVPQFLPLFADANATLPLLTQCVFWVAEVLQTYWWLILALGAGAAWSMARLLEDSARRIQLDELLLRVPVLGDLLRALDTARFCRTLGVLLAGGVSLLTALTLARGTIMNRALSRKLDTLTTEVGAGGRIAAALRHAGVLPVRAVQLIEVGENAGQLPQMLERTATSYDAEVQVTLKRLLTVLEPTLILGLGGIIAIIIISILVAILGLNELVI